MKIGPVFKTGPIKKFTNYAYNMGKINRLISNFISTYLYSSFNKSKMKITKIIQNFLILILSMLFIHNK